MGNSDPGTTHIRAPCLIDSLAPRQLTDLIEKGFQFKSFLAMQFTTQHVLYS